MLLGYLSPEQQSRNLCDASWTIDTAASETHLRPAPVINWMCGYFGSSAWL